MEFHLLLLLVTVTAAVAWSDVSSGLRTHNSVKTQSKPVRRVYTCDESELSPYPDDCRKYYECIKGRLMLRTCPGIDEFSPVYKWCLPPKLAKCGNRDATTENPCHPTTITAEPSPFTVTVSSTTSDEPTTERGSTTLAPSSTSGGPTDEPEPTSEGPTHEPSSTSEGPTEEPSPTSDGPTDEPAPTSEGPTEEPSPTSEGPTDEPSPTSDGPTDEPWPTSEGPTDEPFPTSEGPTDEPSPTREGPTDEPSTTSEGPTDEPSPTSEGPTDEPSPTSEGPTDGPIPTSEGPTDGPYPTSERPTDAPSPTSVGPTDEPSTTSEGPTDEPSPTTEGPTDEPSPTSEGPTDAPSPTSVGPTDEPSTTSEGPTDEPSPTTEGPTDEPSPTSEGTTDAPSPTSVGPTDEPSTTSEGPTDEPSPTTEGPTDEPSPTSEGPTDAPSPTSVGPTDEPSTTSEGPTDEPSPTTEGPTDEPSPTSEGPTDAPSPTSVGPTDEPSTTSEGPTDEPYPTTEGPTDEPTPTSEGPTDAPSPTSEGPTDEPSPTTLYPPTCTDGMRYPDNQDCSRYYKCVHGTAIHKRCPPDMLFSKIFSWCMPYLLVHCDSTETIPGIAEQIIHCVKENLNVTSLKTAIVTVHETESNERKSIEDTPTKDQDKVHLIPSVDAAPYEPSITVKTHDIENRIPTVTVHETESNESETKEDTPTKDKDEFHWSASDVAIPSNTVELHDIENTRRILPTIAETTNSPDRVSILSSYLCRERQIYPDPSDCGRYYQCLKGVMKHESCRPGKEYSEHLRRCVSPAQAKCTVSSKFKPIVFEAHSKTAKGAPHNKLVWLRSHMKDNVMPKIVLDNNSLARRRPNPDSCETYYDCFLGFCILATCEEGQEFSPTELKCMSPDKANCNLAAGPSKAEESQTTKDNDIFCTYTASRPIFNLADPTDPTCRKYRLCYYGILHEKTCEQELEYSSFSNSCVDPSKSDCGHRH